MQGTRHKIFGLIVMAAFPLFAAPVQKRDLPYYRRAFFKSYQVGDMAVWPSLIAEMEQAKPVDWVWQTEIVKALYGLVGYQLGTRDKKRAKVNVAKADLYLDTLLAEHPDHAQLHSLAGAFYGYKISLSFYKAPFLGPKSLSHIEQAIQLDPTEPMGYIEKGNSLMYRPAVLGADKNQALTLYRKALKLMDSRKDRKEDWQQLMVCAFVLKGLYETNRGDEAKAFRADMQKEYGTMAWVEKYVGVTFFD